jgi:type VI secretion system secreted protein Hcp
MALVDYFLKLDGVEGESQDSKHKGEVEIESFSWGATQTGIAAHGAGMGAGKVQMQDFHFVMKVNKSSPKLMLHCAQGSHIKSAILTCRKAGKEQQEYLKVTFSDILVSSYQTSGSGGSDVIPIDQISLNFTKLEMEYKEQKQDGTLGGAIKAFYNVKEQKGG